MKITCDQCGRVFDKQRSKVAQHRRNHCSNPCKFAAQVGVSLPKRDFEDRFWSKVAKGVGDSCWQWTASFNNGYGQFNPHRRNMLAHRLSYQLEYGPIADDVCVLHRCDNPKCVRPDHLFLGTRGDNNRDMWAKGRGRPGRRYSSVSVETRTAICRAYQSPGATLKTVSKITGVSPSHVGRILRGEVPPPP